jgi:hypothetical protein
MKPGSLSSAALMVSGLAGVLMPQRVGAALELPPMSDRAVAETRAGLGGTYAALGAWGLLTRDQGVQRAIGFTWLGAAGARLWALRKDEPKANWTYWSFLAAELGLGVAAVLLPEGLPRRASASP